MSLDKAITELVSFLTPTTRDDLRLVAIQQVLGLSVSNDGVTFMKQQDDLLVSLVKLSDDPLVAVKKAVFQSVVNLSADEELALRLSTLEGGLLIRSLLKSCAHNDSITETACMALSNISHSQQCCTLVWQSVSASQTLNFEGLIALVSPDNETFHHLGLLLCNLSQISDVRRHLLDQKKNVIKTLIPLINYSKSQVRRKGIVGTIRNCCFDTANHDWLLGDEVDLLPALAFPLAGHEELDDDENDKLPVELQYLGQDKIREEDPEIRKMLIEAITQLCATKKGRIYIKEKGIYYILRELHKWEPCKMVTIACENLVDILIGDEPQPGMENLKEVEIPLDLQEKFKKMDEEDMLNTNNSEN